MSKRGLSLLCGLFLLASCETYIGDSCSYSTYNTDCPQGAYCDETMPGGYCTKTPCRKDSDCPGGGAVCIRFENGETYCMADCSDDGDCRHSYSCLDNEDKTESYCGVAPEVSN